MTMNGGISDDFWVTMFFPLDNSLLPMVFKKRTGIPILSIESGDESQDWQMRNPANSECGIKKFLSPRPSAFETHDSLTETGEEEKDRTGFRFLSGNSAFPIPHSAFSRKGPCPSNNFMIHVF